MLVFVLKTPSNQKPWHDKANERINSITNVYFTYIAPNVLPMVSEWTIVFITHAVLGYDIN